MATSMRSSRGLMVVALLAVSLSSGCTTYANSYGYGYDVAVYPRYARTPYPYVGYSGRIPYEGSLFQMRRDACCL
jgi:hypothetical protein